MENPPFVDDSWWFMMIHEKAPIKGIPDRHVAGLWLSEGPFCVWNQGNMMKWNLYMFHMGTETHTHTHIYIYNIYIYTDLACKIRVSSASTRPWEPTRQSQKLEFQQFKHENSHKFMQNWPKEWPAPTSYRSHQYCSGPTFGCPEKPLTRLITCSHAHTQLSRHIISKPRPNMAKCW